MSIFARRTGTNVTLSDITQAASDLQMDTAAGAIRR